MANTKLSMPTPNGPQPRPGAWPNQNVPQPGFNGWTTPNAPPAYLSTAPTMVAPLPPPATKPKPRTGRFIAWSLWVFAGGLAAGPALADYADEGLATAISWVAINAPSFLQPYLPKPLPVLTEPDHPSRDRGTVATAPVAAEPATIAEAPAPPEPTAEIVAPPPKVEAPVAAAIGKPATPARPATQPQPRPAHSTPRKVAVAEPAAPPRVAPEKSARHKADDSSDPFVSDGHGPAEPAAKEPVAKAVVAPAVPAKRTHEKSGDALDDLMGGGPSGSAGKPKDRHNTSKEIDAMLLDVQKPLPPAPPKRVESAPLPPLTAADINKAMAGVKSDAKACGKRFKQTGMADLKVTVGKDGRVTDVALNGPLADSSVAHCVIKAARGAAFPHSAGLKFDYRIDIQ